MVEPGRRCLGDRYELHQLIATGGMGQVWRGQDLALQRPVAVKVLRSEYTGDPTFLARFRAEAQNAASLSHPNIAAVFDYGEVTAQDGTGETLAYLVMELVTGEPLSALLAREGGLGTPTTLSILRQTAFALGEAHRAGMVHRDVKPGNILVCSDGHVKITDFGIAWSARSVALTRTGQVIGTPQYLSPEQAEGKLATPASDVYGLGLIGYECLTGRPAFEGDNPVTIALKQVRQDPEPLPVELPPAVRTLIGRALAKNPAARFADGDAFVAAIEDVLAGRAIPPAPDTRAVDVPVGAVPPPGASREDARPTRVTGGVLRPPVARRRSRISVVLLPLLGLLAGAGIAAGVLNALAHDTPSSPAAAAEQREDAAIVLDAADYIGQPVAQVVADLEALGLSVDQRAQPAPDAVPGMVTDVRPAGRQLARGDTVVVYFAEAGTRAGGGGGGGGAEEHSAVTGAALVSGGSTEPSAATATEASPTDEPSATEATEEPTLSASPTPSEPTSAEPTESSATESTTTEATESTAATSTSTAAAGTSTDAGSR
ncbi:MAG: pknA2 [Blastococcus sp.]|nr:pknA2 [Blastococcus sp.]